MSLAEAALARFFTPPSVRAEQDSPPDGLAPAWRREDSPVLMGCGRGVSCALGHLGLGDPMGGSVPAQTYLNPWVNLYPD